MIINLWRAKTLGIDNSDVFPLFDAWRRQEIYKQYCENSGVREVLEFGGFPHVTEVDKDIYKYGVTLQIVTRVYMTRQIQYIKNVIGGRGVALIGLLKTGEGEGEKEASGQNSKEGEANRDDQAGQFATRQEALGNQQELSGIYDRPVIFGYRAVTIDLRRAP